MIFYLIVFIVNIFFVIVIDLLYFLLCKNFVIYVYVGIEYVVDC